MKALASLAISVVATVAIVVIGIGVLGTDRSMSDEAASTSTTAAGPRPVVHRGRHGAATRAVSSPRANYDPVRLPVGLGAAVVSLSTAAMLVRRTDWSAVGEAAAPQIDDAVYADLDAIVAALTQD